MPRGFGGVKQASSELEARRGGSGPGALYFKLRPGEETVVRFLEQDDDIFWCMMHEVERPDRAWGDTIPCLDQEKDGTPCPGCEKGLDLKFKGFINLIWEDAPIFKRDDQGKMVKDSTGDPVILGTKPQVALWSSGIRLFEELGEVNDNFKGLMSRRFRVKRKGSGFDTKYHIAPEDVDSGPQPMTDAEKALANEKFDLNPFVKPPSYEDFAKRLNGGVLPSNGGGAASAPPANPFMRSRPGA